jgi:hypothetical protein
MKRNKTAHYYSVLIFWMNVVFVWTHTHKTRYKYELCVCVCVCVCRWCLCRCVQMGGVLMGVWVWWSVSVWWMCWGRRAFVICLAHTNVCLFIWWEFGASRRWHCGNQKQKSASVVTWKLQVAIWCQLAFCITHVHNSRLTAGLQISAQQICAPFLKNEPSWLPTRFLEFVEPKFVNQLWAVNCERELCKKLTDIKWLLAIFMLLHLHFFVFDFHNATGVKPQTPTI